MDSSTTPPICREGTPTACSGRVYDLEEAAQLMRTTAETLAAFVRTGELPAARIGKKHLVLHEDLMSFLRAKIDSATAERRRQCAPQSPSALLATKPKSRRKCLPALHRILADGPPTASPTDSRH